MEFDIVSIPDEGEWLIPQDSYFKIAQLYTYDPPDDMFLSYKSPLMYKERESPYKYADRPSKDKCNYCIVNILK